MLGLDPRRQGVSWEESESSKKHKDKKKAEDRYFSKVTHQMLKSEPALHISPTNPDCSDVISSSHFLPLGDDVGQSNGKQTGKRLSHSTIMV